MSEQIFSKAGPLMQRAQSGRVLLSQLSTPEQFLISALRLWNQGRHEQGPCCCRSLLRNGFQAADLSQAAFEHFDSSLSAIAATQIESASWIAAPRQAALTPSEHRIVRIVAHCQRDDVATALGALRNWLPPTTARVVLTSIYAFAQAFANAGLILRGDAHAAPTTTTRDSIIPLRPRSIRLH
ncbi:MAG: hypothetical protein JNM81_05385 [Rhodospirillaceae bacterium]|nr:hypothetical protein [Rhodospirillaceae bacterium]